jgi:hypothetical protein
MWITKKDKSAEIGGQEGFKDEKKKYVPLDEKSLLYSQKLVKQQMMKIEPTSREISNR